MDASFIGFDLGIKDKNDNSLCVGDKVKEVYDEEEPIEIFYGKVIYSTDKKAFGILWEEDNYCELFADANLKILGKCLEKVDEN